MNNEAPATATLFTITSTLTPPLTPVPSASPLPPPLRSQPTVVPVEGTSATQINVRAEPSTASNILGIIPANTKVEITGKDPGENWWEINYPQGQRSAGKGWVTAQYITTATNPDVPIIGGAAVDPNEGNAAVVQQQLNVRSGPGTDFNSLGVLNPRDVVRVTGKDQNGIWLQIDFDAGPEGKGWVNAASVQARGVENLPILTEAGVIVGTGTPTGIPFTPTPTVIPAWADNDSPGSPVASVVFEPIGSRTLIYNGDISAPEGDSQDWIAFTPYGKIIFAGLACGGNGSPKVEMTGNALSASTELTCGDQMKQIIVQPGLNYLIHLQVISSADDLQYINYILTIKTSP